MRRAQDAAAAKLARIAHSLRPDAKSAGTEAGATSSCSLMAGTIANQVVPASVPA